MKREIKKIIRKHIRVEDDDIIFNHKAASKEIANMSMEFARWCTVNASVNYMGIFMYIETGKEFDSFKDLYKFWRDHFANNLTPSLTE